MTTKTKPEIHFDETLHTRRQVEQAFHAVRTAALYDNLRETVTTSELRRQFATELADQPDNQIHEDLVALLEKMAEVAKRETPHPDPAALVARKKAAKATEPFGIRSTGKWGPVVGQVEALLAKARKVDPPVQDLAARIKGLIESDHRLVPLRLPQVLVEARQVMKGRRWEPTLIYEREPFGGKQRIVAGLVKTTDDSVAIRLKTCSIRADNSTRIAGMDMAWSRLKTQFSFDRHSLMSWAQAQDVVLLREEDLR